MVIVPRWKCVPITPGPFDPQDVGKQVLPHIEGQVLDRSAIAERHPWAVHVGGGIDIAATGAEALDQRLVREFHVDNRGLVRRRCGHHGHGDAPFVQRIRVST
jgi:hypothetical protein